MLQHNYALQDVARLMTQSPMSINFRDVVRRWISDDNRRLVAIAAVTALHLSAAVILLATEVRWLPWIVFLLSWMFWNCIWLMLLCRPAVSSAVTLSFLIVLILLSRFKHEILLMTVKFLFLMQVFPGLVSLRPLPA